MRAEITYRLNHGCCAWTLKSIFESLEEKKKFEKTLESAGVHCSEIDSEILQNAFIGNSAKYEELEKWEN